MSELMELTTLIFNTLLMVVGVLVVIMILRVYGLYRIMKINRSVMTPMLLAGLFIALSGITELTEDYLGEFGVVAHSIAMLLTGVSFAYGIYGYHQMLNRATKLR